MVPRAKPMKVAYGNQGAETHPKPRASATIAKPASSSATAAVATGPGVKIGVSSTVGRALFRPTDPPATQYKCSMASPEKETARNVAMICMISPSCLRMQPVFLSLWCMDSLPEIQFSSQYCSGQLSSIGRPVQFITYRGRHGLDHQLGKDFPEQDMFAAIENRRRAGSVDKGHGIRACPGRNLSRKRAFDSQ